MAVGAERAEVTAEEVLRELASPSGLRSSVQFQTARQCGARTKSGQPCRSPATKKGRCRLHGGASGSGGPPGERNGQYRHGERTKAAIAEQRKCAGTIEGQAGRRLDSEQFRSTQGPAGRFRAS
jgi:hypothetical protein